MKDILPNPFMWDPQGRLLPQMVYEGAVSGPRLPPLSQIVAEVFPSVDDAKAKLRAAQQTLRAYRIILGSEERSPNPHLQYMAASTLRDVRRLEAKVCAALDRLWLAQEHAA